MSSLTRMYFYLKILMHLLTYCICISQTYDIVLFASFLISHGFLDRGSFRISPAWIRASQWPVLVVERPFGCYHSRCGTIKIPPCSKNRRCRASPDDISVWYTCIWQYIIASWTEWQFFFYFRLDIHLSYFNLWNIYKDMFFSDIS